MGRQSDMFPNKPQLKNPKYERQKEKLKETTFEKSLARSRGELRVALLSDSSIIEGYYVRASNIHNFNILKYKEKALLVGSYY